MLPVMTAILCFMYCSHVSMALVYLYKDWMGYQEMTLKVTHFKKKNYFRNILLKPYSSDILIGTSSANKVILL